MKDVTTYAGIDAHKKDLFVSMLVGDQHLPPVSWKVANEPQAVRRLVGSSSERRLARCGCCPCGYALQRQLTTLRVSCEVIAPALMSRKPGERVKTNRRDGCKLVGAGTRRLLTAVQPPTPEDEAVRDRLSRGRLRQFRADGSSPLLPA